MKQRVTGLFQAIAERYRFLKDLKDEVSAFAKDHIKLREKVVKELAKPDYLQAIKSTSADELGCSIEEIDDKKVE